MNGVASPGIALAFQSSYRTFSPAQFAATFVGKGFTKTRANAPVSADPGAQPAPTTMYSKGSLLAFMNDSENTVQFHILNTLKARDHMDEVMGILGSLNFGPTSIANMTAGITATVKADHSPIFGLTRLVDRKLVAQVQKTHGNGGDVAVTSIRLALIRSRDESLTVAVEPFGSDPEGAYRIDVRYAAKTVEKFNAFVEKIGEDVFRGIVESIGDSGRMPAKSGAENPTQSAMRERSCALGLSAVGGGEAVRRHQQRLADAQCVPQPPNPDSRRRRGADDRIPPQASQRHRVGQGRDGNVHV